MSETASYVPVARAEDIAPGTARRVVLNGVPICVTNVEGQFFAVDDTCSHEDYSLSEGEVYDDCTIECPKHGSLFSLKTGRALTLPAVLPIRTYPVIVENGEVKVAPARG